MKKILAVALSVIMLLGIIPFAAMAAEPDFVFDFEASKTQVLAGDVVDITVSVTGSEDAASGGWQFELLLPEGVEYVANSGAIDPDLKATISATDDCSFTESSKIVVCVGTDGLTNLNQKNKILTFQVKVAEDAAAGETFEIAACEWEVMDGNCDALPADKYELNYATLEVVVVPDFVFDFEASKTNVVAGETVDVTVSVTGTEDAASGGWQFELLLPEGVEYVANSGAIDPDLKATISATDDCSFTESSKIVVCVGTDGLTNLNQKNKIVTFQVKVADDVTVGDTFEIAACEWEVMDGNCDALPATAYELNYATLTIVDHICSADKLTFVEATDADCVNDGNKAYYECECGTKYADADAKELAGDVIVPALGHTEAEAVEENRKDADCENAGSYDMVVYCSVCGEELSKETTTIDALGHDYEEVVTAPDCVNAGYTTYTCSVCGDKYVADEVAALGHTEGEVVYEKVSNATCTEGGTGDAVIYCSVCGEELSRVTSTVPALGHTDGDAVKEKEVAADCENAGSYDSVVYCTVCGAEL